MEHIKLIPDWTYDESTKIISTPDNPFVPHPKGLGHLLFESMKKHSKNVAQINGETGELDYYSSFFERSLRTAIEMKSRGIKPKDVVSVCSHNHMNSHLPLISAAFVGAHLAALDPALSEEDIKHLVNEVDLKLIFVDEKSEATIRKVVNESKLSTQIIVFERDFGEFVEPKKDEEEFQPFIPDSLDETALILFSSGTTGLPKGVCLSHAYILYYSNDQVLDVSLAFTSLYWISVTILMTTIIIQGKARLVCKRFDSKQIWYDINEFKVNYLFLSPYYTNQMVENKPEDFTSSLIAMVIAGNQMSSEELKTARAAMPNTVVFFCYGQTELTFLANPLYEIVWTKPNSVGCPVTGVTYKIVDPETEQTVGLNESGELRVKCKYVMNGYYKKDSRDAWDEDGFLKTGDVCYFDKDFCLYVVDRVKEMFKFREIHYVPAKVECLLQKHPEIEMSVIVGVPHPEDQNHALAVVVRKEGSKIESQEIIDYVDKHIDNDVLKLRAGVKFVERMPLTPSGKINRRTLKKMFTK
ncbi:PREDICTED: luciferin 4-monooxygenase-like [Nicrophorus vespilloides]|uniref:Luciferin 4-monooxygenase-like n=1 Tax=Nicrophorus vespilloides TaxID=110193 RepID=A0ABM1MMH7_NICVS|nr:PREDICTED: luciferin 4-monooxygenase-like [Nicrophorus vespilloides]